MNPTRTTAVRRAFFPLSVALVCAVLAAAYLSFGVVPAIKGGYALLGLLVAAAAFAALDATEVTRRSAIDADRYGKGVFLFVLLGVVVAALANDRAAALLLALPGAYFLLALQLRGEPEPRWVLPQILALFALSPVTKYLTTGFYYGSTDTFSHVAYVERLVATGSLVGLRRYEYFPGLHVATGALGLVGGVDPYDALLLLGTVTYAVAVIVVYLVARITAGGPRDALYVAAAVAMLEPMLYFASYVFPQSLAVVLLLAVLYVACRVDRSGRALRRPLVVVLFALGGLAILTHHLTFVLFLPPLLALVAVQRIDRRFGYRERLRVGATPLVTVYLAAIAYWEVGDQFFDEFVRYVRETALATLFASGSSAPQETVALGGTLPEPGVRSAARSLLSPEGIYFVALAAVFVLGIVAVLVAPERYRRRRGLVVVGVLGALAVFRTPIALSGILRIAVVGSAFVAVVLGIGLFALLRSEATPRGRALGVALVVVLGTTAPLIGAAGDDLYALNAGPDLYELYPTPEPEVALSAAELAQIEAAGRFVEANDLPPSTLSVTGRALERGGMSPDTRVTATNSSLATGTPYLVYRESWPDHRTAYDPPNAPAGGTVVVDETWLNETVATESKVYTAGEVGVLHDGHWYRSSVVFGDERGASTPLDPDRRDAARSPSPGPPP